MAELGAALGVVLCGLALLALGVYYAERELPSLPVAASYDARC